MPQTKKGFFALARRGGWHSRAATGRGGTREEFHISSLPQETQEYLKAQYGLEAKNSDFAGNGRADFDAGVADDVADVADPGAAPDLGLATPLATEPKSARPEASSIYIDLGIDAQHDGTPVEQQQDAWLYLQSMQEVWCQRQGIDKIVDCDLAFAAAWNDGQIDAPAWMQQQIKRLSRSTLARKRAKRQKAGVAALARKNASKRAKKFDLCEDMQAIVIGMIAEYPHCSPAQVYKALCTRLGHDEVPTRRTLQRWIARWKEENAELFLSFSNPDAWKSNYMVAFGSLKEGIERLYQKLEADSTPADVMLLDGRHSIVGMIDIYSQQAKLLVTKTSRGTAISTLLRHWILSNGVPETIKTDNGKDYTGHHFRRCLSDLGIAQQTCKPFAAWEKGHIERFFRTFAHDLLELLAGFIGHNVAERQAIRSRQSFAERLFVKGDVFAVRMSSEELQKFCDQWIESYMHRPHAGLDGEKPFQRVANWQHPIRRVADPRALDMLLAEAPGTGLRTVNKDGVRLDGATFIAPELGAWMRRQVHVRYDPTDIGRIYCYDPSTQAFICVAECPERTGISRQMVTGQARRRQREILAEGRKQMQVARKEASLSNIAQEILDADLAEAAKVRMFPRPVEEHTTPALAAAAEAASSATPALPRVRQMPTQAEARPRPDRPQIKDLDAVLDRVVRQWQSGESPTLEDATDALRYSEIGAGKGALQFLVAGDDWQETDKSYRAVREWLKTQLRAAQAG
ncbi:DDE-type integrase/transposase/recombinase [Synechococcales cyanobacterium C]|uniref:DDE-type integrase/transposase/recombinase n=2 Tax=Petrachloros TaxID=2918834 RepID=A0A8K2AC68_9CYAN|nr:Mu transposase C-terminal domain-containing protein [Petrachloros mirabilis]NCJ05174.1 DDE-type integrase/transposase/recombinase [Petrachloros mirabilis ULC683]